MSITFQKPAQQHSEGSLLLGAIFGGLTSEVGQMADMAMDAAEISSELHKYNFSKKQVGANQNNFTLGQKNSLGSMFSNKVFDIDEPKPEVQTRYLNAQYNYNRSRSMGMRLAA
ncbi:MAG: hypothetical protein MRY79_02360 [Alphaproteobacteria bacterium]|nr:hypothetical protein [Alphaproteobacteria bacterium]